MSDIWLESTELVFLFTADYDYRNRTKRPLLGRSLPLVQNIWRSHNLMPNVFLTHLCPINQYIGVCWSLFWRRKTFVVIKLNVWRSFHLGFHPKKLCIYDKYPVYLCSKQNYIKVTIQWYFRVSIFFFLTSTWTFSNGKMKQMSQYSWKILSVFLWTDILCPQKLLNRCKYPK